MIFNNVLVNGCSFSRGPHSWPYYLQAMQNFNLINLAQAGAGNNYIHETTVEELANRSYDLVIVMWSGLERFDVRVDNACDFDQSTYTSCYQKTRNDWPEKIVFPVNDQDRVADDWVFGCGYINQEPELMDTNLFNGIYKHMGIKQFVYHSLQRIIALQSFLKQQHIPYLFTFYRDYKQDLLEHKELYQMIDQHNVFAEHNLTTLAQSINDIDHTRHPGPTAHRRWAELINNHLNERFRI